LAPLAVWFALSRATRQVKLLGVACCMGGTVLVALADSGVKIGDKGSGGDDDGGTVNCSAFF